METARRQAANERRSKINTALTEAGYSPAWTAKTLGHFVDCWVNRETGDVRLIHEYSDGSGIDVFSSLSPGNSMVDLIVAIGSKPATKPFSRADSVLPIVEQRGSS